MVNRNRSDLELARQHHDPGDDDDMFRGPGPASWFGIRMKTSTIIPLGFSISGVMFVLIFARWLLADRIPGLPHESLWFDIGFAGVTILMSMISLSMFVAASNVYRREIRETRARIARHDNATDEEVEQIVQQSEKQMDRRMLRRLIVWMALIIALVVVLGSNLVFPWGGTLAFATGALVLFIGGLLWAWRGQDIVEKLIGSKRDRLD